MPDNYQIKNNKQSAIYSVFQMPRTIALCEKFSDLSREDDNYSEAMKKLKSLSSYNEKNC